jgi:F-box-like
MDVLPPEIVRQCLARLSPDDLCAAAAVCRAWKRIVIDSEALWEQKLLLDQQRWNAVVGTRGRNHDGGSHTSSHAGPTADQLFEHGWNLLLSLTTGLQPTTTRTRTTTTTTTLLPTEDMVEDDYGSRSDDGSPHSRARALRAQYTRLWRHNSSDWLSKSAVRSLGSQDSFGDEAVLVPIAGEGLATSCKKLLYSMMWKKDTFPFPVVGMRPGNEGIGSGVNFLVNGVKLSLAPLYRSDERGVLDNVTRPAWRDFFGSARGFIFVYDSSGTADTNRAQLDKLRRAAGAAAPQSPLLVIVAADSHTSSSSSSSSSSSGDANANSNSDSGECPHTVAAAMQLDTLGFGQWAAHRIDGSSLDGMPGALAWLAAGVRRR